MLILFFFFFNDTATTEIYTLSLHDALPIFKLVQLDDGGDPSASTRNARKLVEEDKVDLLIGTSGDRKSTRLNSSHLGISYAVFCLKKKTKAASVTTKPAGTIEFSMNQYIKC